MVDRLAREEARADRDKLGREANGYVLPAKTDFTDVERLIIELAGPPKEGPAPPATRATSDGDEDDASEVDADRCPEPNAQASDDRAAFAKIRRFVATWGRITSAEATVLLRRSPRTTRRILRQMVDRKELEPRSSGPGTYYVLPQRQVGEAA
jgi:hypothetical protein